MDYQKLTSEIDGSVILPSDARYDEERQLYNAMIDKKPGAIVKCKNTGDIAAAVKYAQSNDLEVSIRSGGHNGAGLGLCDDGLAIDLSLMKNITIDKDKKTAVIEAGCLLKEIDAKTHEYGLALPSGIIGTTGIGGITLGGGLGYLSRKCGLTIDSLLEAEVVLADGSVVTASEKENPDLLWALKGGGGNFGVVSSFTFQLHEISEVYAGPMFWPIEKSKEAMIFFREILAKADNDLYGFFAFLKVPPAEPFPEHLHNQNVCGVLWNYTGPVEKREEIFKPIREFGPPILDFVGPMPLPALQGMFDALYPPGLQWYWKSHYFRDLTEDAMDKFIEYGSKIPLGFHSTMHLYPVNGKTHEVASDATAWAHRDVNFVAVMVGIDPDPANKDIATNWCKGYYEAVHPFAAPGTYVNFMMEEKEGRIESTYGPNMERLREIKRKYDPDNFFHINQNIKP
ncbi:MAG: FAD-binding oxidoreductase [Bacteroidota bacterium]